MSDWGDWAQNRRIQDAEASISALAASAASERRRLTEQLRRQSGDLKQQIDQLREAFIAFVELEDVRGELSQHVDAAAARRYAREVVAATVVGSSPTGLVEPPDVAGYWLPSAARAIAAANAGRPDDAARELEEARRRDAQRTAGLVCLLEAVRREPHWSRDLLASVLPADPPVTRLYRTLWTAVAEGRLGPDASEQLAAVLASLAAGVDEDAVIAHLAALHAEKRNDVPAEVAAGRLRRLRALVEGRQPDPAADTADTTDTAESEDPLADCLRELVDEGAPHEAEILQRMQDARTRMGGLAATGEDARWDAPAGEVVDLLLADLGSTASPPRHDLAVRVLAPVLARTAERLHDEANAPAATETRVELRGHTEVTVSSDRPDDGAWREKVSRTALLDHDEPRWWRPAAAVAGVAAVLGFVLIVASPEFAWVGVLGLVAAGVLLYRIVTTRRAGARAVAGALHTSERSLENARTTLTDRHRRSTAAREAAVGDRAAIDERLARRATTSSPQ